MASLHRWAIRVVSVLKKQGWGYRYGSKHLVLYPADKTQRCFTVSLTPSDPYSISNTLKEIRKAGGNI